MSLLTPGVGEDLPVITRGEGIYLFDTNGNRYIDGSSGVAVANIGHGVQEIVDAMTAQASKVAYVYRDHFVSESAQQLAEIIATQWAPDGLDAVWFSSGGSEAVESAFRLARQYHVEAGDASRFKIISTWNSYHGSTMGALAASGRTRPRALYQPYFSGAWPHIDTPYCYRCPYGLSYPACAVRCATDLERAVLHEGPENVAAFILEPIVGSTTGGTYPPREYFQIIREICDRYGVLLIVDEVMSGFGRTGKKFAVDHWGVIPDIIACGKGLGSGYAPIFATLVHERIVQRIHRGSRSVGLGNTYNANPLSCAVGLAVLEYVQRENLTENAREKGSLLRAGFEDLRALPVVGDVRGLGLMQGVEFVSNRTTKEAFPSDLQFATKVRTAARRRGLLLTARGGTIDGARGDHIFLTPPLTSSAEEIAMITSIVKESIVEVFETVPRVK